MLTRLIATVGLLLRLVTKLSNAKASLVDPGLDPLYISLQGQLCSGAAASKDSLGGKFARREVPKQFL